VPYCGNDEKIYPKTVIIVALSVIILAFLVILSNNAFAQRQNLNDRMLYEVVKQISGPTTFFEI
jgi:hypothetical protein